MFVFRNPCARAELHQKKHVRKLCPATLNYCDVAPKIRVHTYLSEYA